MTFSGFVSAGMKKSAKEEAEETIKANEKGSDDDEDNDTFSSNMIPNRPKPKKKKAKAEFVGGQIAGLRKPGYDQPVSLGKGFGDWEKHTKGIGAKLLLKMGYEAGKGLGKNKQGRTTIVEAHLRKGKGAVGAYGKEGNRPSKTSGKRDSEEEEAEEFIEKLHQWKKGGSAGAAGPKKVKYIYKSADQILEDGKWRQVSATASEGGQESKVKIIDMTGKEQRILSSYHAIGAQKIRPDDGEDQNAVENMKKSVNFDLPELRHNVDLLLDQFEEELIANDRALKYHKNRVEVLKKEEEKLSILCQHESSEINTLNEILEAVEKLEVLHEKGDLDLDSAREMLEKLAENYPKEYHGLQMPYIAMTTVVPLLKNQLKSWNCLVQPHQYIEEFIQWKNILGHNANEHRQTNPMAPYHAVLWESWMPTVRQAITSWNPKDPDPLISFLGIWNQLLPRWMQINIFQHILLPKLQSAVELWDPTTDQIPIDSWIIPWLPILDDQLAIVYPTIRNKLANALKAWHPSDGSAKQVLRPWKDIWKPEDMLKFTLKNILPKLEQCMAMELIINPVQQDLNPWFWVMDWLGFLPQAAMLTLLERHFFPKWLQVLAQWLNQNPNYKEVTNWYKGWKDNIPQQLVNTPQVQHQLQQSLNMMTRVVNMSSHPMSQQPGASAEMSGLNANERRFTAPTEMRLGASSAAPSMSDAVKMSSQIASQAPGSYRDLIAKKCEDRGTLFRPIPGKYQEAKQVYQCGLLTIYLDRHVIYVKKDGMWVPTSLNSMLDTAS